MSGWNINRERMKPGDGKYVLAFALLIIAIFAFAPAELSKSVASAHEGWRYESGTNEADPPRENPPWDVKTKVFWEVSSLNGENRLTEGRAEQLVNLKAHNWVEENERIGKVLKIERRWDIELVKPSIEAIGVFGIYDLDKYLRYLVFTITVHYLEEEK